MDQWHYAMNGLPQGPVGEGELRDRIARGELTSDTLVWRQGMAAWEPLSKHPELMPTEVPEPPALTSESPYLPPAGLPGAESAFSNVPNYLWQSIAVTILCCWPLGIPAIVYASKVDPLKARGDLEGARSASDSAKLWCYLSAGCCVGLILVGLLTGVITGSSN